jgi:hypothetical protein
VTTTDFGAGASFGSSPGVFTNDFTGAATSMMRLTGTLIAPSATTIRELMWLNNVRDNGAQNREVMFMRETFGDTALAIGDAIAGRFLLNMDV